MSQFANRTRLGDSSRSENHAVDDMGHSATSIGPVAPHQAANYTICGEPLLTACRQEIHNQPIEQQGFLGMQPMAGIGNDPGFGLGEVAADHGLMLGQQSCRQYH